jgi:hypothetical protein
MPFDEDPRTARLSDGLAREFIRLFCQRADAAHVPFEVLWNGIGKGVAFFLARSASLHPREQEALDILLDRFTQDLRAYAPVVLQKIDDLFPGDLPHD